MPLLPFCHLRDIFPRPGEVFLIEGGFGSTGSCPQRRLKESHHIKENNKL